MLAGGQLTVIDTSSVSLRLPPSPTGEGLSKPSAQSFISFGIALFNKRLQNVSIYLCFRETRHFVSLLQWEKVARFTATDEVLPYVYYQNKPHLYMFAPRHAPKIQPPCLGDADRVCSTNRSIPHWRRLINPFIVDSAFNLYRIIR